MNAAFIYVFIHICLVVVGFSLGCNNGINPKDVIQESVSEQIDIQNEHKPEDAQDLVQDQEFGSPKLEKKRYTYRVICGVSMGANAVTIAAHHPDQFDVVGALGGYVDFRYMAHLLQYFFLGGFCPMEKIISNLDKIDTPFAFCGPVIPTNPWEWDDWDFNHWHYGDSGGHWGRDFYLNVLEGFVMAYGNFLYHNPEHPLLPPGVPEKYLEMTDDEKCKKPIKVGKPYNYNAEYNPNGEFNLITFCDGDTPIDCQSLNIEPCDDSNPIYRKLKGDYDPSQPHKKPVRFMLAVDYNNNGKRDYSEPVVVNLWERFEDVGIDGCSDRFEDGKGGCNQTPSEDAGFDPNKDNFHLLENPSGTEGNFEYDDGEPFYDFGIDGVPEKVSGFKDEGEGNNVWDCTPYGRELLKQDARTFIKHADIKDLKRITWFWDGGIRDAIHALTSAYFQFNALKMRGLPTKEWDDWTDNPKSVAPNLTCEDFLSHIGEIDFSASFMGENVIVRYGKLDATPEEIAMGDGKHVGMLCQVINRLLGFFAFALHRLPNKILKADGDADGQIIYSSYWSESLKNRRRFSISLPPGYNKPENKDLTYPLVIFLPGHGMTSESMVQSGIVMNAYMGMGLLPRFILLAPEGQCCFVHKKTKVRYCGCLKEGDPFECLDPECKGKHDECKVEKIPKSELQQECNGGHFFVNHKSNSFGEKDASEYMRYEDSLFELLEFVDKNFRTRKVEEIEVSE